MFSTLLRSCTCWYSLSCVSVNPCRYLHVQSHTGNSDTHNYWLIFYFWFSLYVRFHLFLTTKNLWTKYVQTRVLERKIWKKSNHEALLKLFANFSILFAWLIKFYGHDVRYVDIWWITIKVMFICFVHSWLNVHQSTRCWQIQISSGKSNHRSRFGENNLTMGNLLPSLRHMAQLKVLVYLKKHWGIMR